MVKALFHWCRRALAAPFTLWRRRQGADIPPPANVVGRVYETLSGDSRAVDKGSAMQRQLRRAVLDTLVARVGPGHLAVVPLLMAMAFDEPSPPKRRIYERKALTLARTHYGHSHPLTLFLEGQTQVKLRAGDRRHWPGADRR